MQKQQFKKCHVKINESFVKKKNTGEHKLISYLKNTCKNKQILCNPPILKNNLKIT